MSAIGERPALAGVHGSASGSLERGAGRRAREHLPRRRTGCSRRRRASTTACCCRSASRSPAPRSSSTPTRPRSCRPAGGPADESGNLILTRGDTMSASQTRVDPITAAVIAGALDSIAVEMGHKLARMSFSSIIRESEDFGCVICDSHARQLCESAQSTPLQSGPIPGYIAGINRRFAELGLEWKPGDVVDPQPRLLRRLAPARRRLLRADLLRRRAGRLLGDDRPPPRSRRAHARHLRDRRRHRRLRRRAFSSTRSRSRRRVGATSGSGSSSATTAAPRSSSSATWTRRSRRARSAPRASSS